MIVELPGFEDLIHNSQSTFKVLLNALSRPGTIKQITTQLTPPSGFNIACAAACLTLFDLETTPVYPEDSTTLLITLGAKGFSPLSDQLPKLTGAGIDGQITMPINLPDTFWQQWQQNHNSYPQGIDTYFFSENKVVGLPRTSIVNY